MTLAPYNLSDLFDILVKVSREEFLDSFPHPLLVQVLDPVQDGSEGEHFTTSRIIREESSSRASGSRRHRISADVFLIHKTAENAFANMITVGRATNNDLVLPYTNVSKFHAYFSHDEGTDVYRLTDANSTNGTFVNQDQLKPDSQRQLANEDSVAFSPNLEFTFFLPGDFYDWAVRLVRHLKDPDGEP